MGRTGYMDKKELTIEFEIEAIVDRSRLPYNKSCLERIETARHPWPGPPSQ
jgi:hypothetical protein